MPQEKNKIADIGTSKIASDSYDVDNIYLTDEGWVYRHFKSTDGSRYWDEIIVAGEVPSGDSPQATNPPKLGTVENPPFETGDGAKDYEYSSHIDSATGDVIDKIETEGGGNGVGDGVTEPVTDIGDLSGTAPTGNLFKGVPYTYTVVADNDAEGGINYDWTAPGGVFGVGGHLGVKSVDITWGQAGQKTVTVTATKAGASDSPVTKSYVETVGEYTLGTASLVGDAFDVALDLGVKPIASCRLEGNNVMDETYAWTVTSGDASKIVFEPDATGSDVLVEINAVGTYELTCTVSSVDAAGVSGDENSPVVASRNIEVYDPVISSTGAATLSGTFEVGETISIDAIATFSGGLEPIVYEYQWQMSDDQSVWEGFESPYTQYDPATVLDNSPTKNLTGVVEGKYIRLQQRATDAAGTVKIAQGTQYGPVTAP